MRITAHSKNLRAYDRINEALKVAEQFDDSADPLICDGYNKDTDEVFFHDSEAEYYVTADGEFNYAGTR